MITRFSQYITLLSALILLAVPNAAFAAQPLLGNVLLTRDLRDPIVVWQASQEIYTMVGDGTSSKDINDRLEHDGLRAIASILPALRKSSGTITLHIMYSKMTPNGLNYKVFTLSGATEYARMQLPVNDAVRNRDRWLSLPVNAKAPGWIRYQPVGRLPGQ